MRRSAVVAGLLLFLLGLLLVTSVIPLGGSVVASSSSPGISGISCSSTDCSVSGTIENPTTSSSTFYVTFCTYANSVSLPLDDAFCLYPTIYAAASFGLKFDVISGVTGNSQLFDNVTLGAGQSQTLTFEIPLDLTYQGSPLFQPGTYYETLCFENVLGSACGVYSSPSTESGTLTTENFLQAFTVSSVPVTTTSTTYTSQTGLVPFLIQYDGATLSSVSPAGSSVTTCTSSCASSGTLESYEATWTTGTTLAITFAFNSAMYTAQACVSSYYVSYTCQPIVSGQAFTETVLAPDPVTGGPSSIVVSLLGSTTPAIVITPEASLPCTGSCPTIGSWSPSSAVVLNPTGSSTCSTDCSQTFTFTPAAGESCSGAWVLYSPGTNDYFESGASGAIQGVTFTYAALQTYVSTQGSSFTLYAGSQSSSNCKPIAYTVTAPQSSGVSSFVCSTTAPNSDTFDCPSSQTFDQVTTLYFEAIPVSGYSVTSLTVSGAPVSSSNGWATVDVDQNLTIGAETALVTTSTSTSSTTTAASSSCVPTGSNAAILVLVESSSTGLPVQGALVSTKGSSSSTNSTGYACLNNLAVPVGSGVIGVLENSGSISVTAAAAGFDSQTSSVSVKEGQQSQVSFLLVQSTSKPPSEGVVAGVLAMAAGTLLFVYGVVSKEPPNVSVPKTPRRKR